MSPRPIPPQQGDEAQLYRDLHADLERVVRAVVRTNDADVADACSFAWLQLLRHQPGRETLFGWLQKVAIREAWLITKRGSRDLSTDTMPLEGRGRGTATDLDTELEAREALHAIAGLPPRQRTYLTLVVSGHTYDEITVATGTSRTALNKRLVRARHTLRTRLQP